eukprot:TRINITY_DN65696_c0_g1_i1.p1 TRINITY_DN65696_c0_g1~~TRINITY_DN65696_c0_g1_i1.p1  ORF type:complete len:462 (-),score=67.95 TRINITY_DN65696_c0_g1_i1:150-1535(-)
MLRRDPDGDAEELQGLTSAASADAEPSDAALQSAGWLKEPKEKDVSLRSDDGEGSTGAVPSEISEGNSSASTAPAQRFVDASSMAKATTFGARSSQMTGDLEMQALKPAEEGSVRDVIREDRTADNRLKKRLYSVWPSRSKFFCGGMGMTGGETELGITPNCSVPNLCVWTCILAPCSLYFVWVFPHLWREGNYTMPLATLAVFFMASGSLLATCCSDPGVLPRREVILATDTADKLQEVLGYDVLARGHVPRDGKGEGGRLQLPVELTSRGYRWCRTCRIVRPPRASHCPDCDNCVLRYDHHCPFVNNCVGQRNYHFFFGFVTSVLCLAIMVLPVLFWFLNSDNFEGAVDAMTTVSTGILKPVFYGLIAIGCLIAIAVLMAGLLWCYHCFLIATKRTTKEFRKNLENVDEEPTLCGARGPRLFDPRAWVDPRELIRFDEAPPPDPQNFCQFCWDPDDAMD